MIKMRLYCVIVAIQIIRVYSTSKIALQNEDEPLTIAAANIINGCFGSVERRSELLVIPDITDNEILKEIHQQSEIANSIVLLDRKQNNRFTYSGKCNHYLNIEVERFKFIPAAVIITIYGVEQLESILSLLKNDMETIWSPESYFLIMLETECDLVHCNNMFKVIWDYWILNAVILCSSNNRSEFNLYTFNPYSHDHSPKWKTIVHETVEVSINSINFNHSWYIFNQEFTKIQFPEDCGNLFFDKTSNLDGYVVPIGASYSAFLASEKSPIIQIWTTSSNQVLKTVAESLRFNIVQVFNHEKNEYGRWLENGSYTGPLNDIYNGRSYLTFAAYEMVLRPDLGMTYPHDSFRVCFASRIVGDRPQWMNLASAKYIWIYFGLSLLSSTVVLYLQNKSHGIVPAYLDAQRLMIGSSIMRTSTVIKDRMILGSVFLVVLILDGAFRGRFISILAVVRPYPNLETLEQLKEQDVEIFGNRNFKTLVGDLELQARFNISLDSWECVNSLQRMKHQRACFGNCRSLLFLTLNLSNVYTSSIPVYSYYIAFLTTVHWPMTNRYSIELHKLVQAGIIEKWQLDIHRELEVESWKVKRATDLPYVRATKLNDLLPAFVLLFVGLFAALIVFAWEMQKSKKILVIRLKK